MKIVLLLLLLLLGGVVHAGSPEPGFAQQLGAALPTDTAFRDENGAPTTLGRAIGGKPTVLVFNYLRCPQLCSVVSEGSVDSLRQLQMSAGRDFSVVTMSIDPTDTPAMAAEWRSRELGRYGRESAAAAWHVLTGDSAAITAVTQAAGFSFTFDPRTRQYGHPAGIVLLTPDGRVSRYLLGVDYPAKALSAGLVAASQGRVGNRAFDLILNCLEGGVPGGRYGRLIWTVLLIAVGATVLVVFGGIAALLLQEHRKRRPAAS